MAAACKPVQACAVDLVQSAVLPVESTFRVGDPPPQLVAQQAHACLEELDPRALSSATMILPRSSQCFEELQVRYQTEPSARSELRLIIPRTIRPA
jgi:hypothetical protein